MTPSVAAPGDTNPSDTTAQLSGTSPWLTPFEKLKTFLRILAEIHPAKTDSATLAENLITYFLINATFSL